MALTTLNLPYSQNDSSNANTAQYYQLHIPHTHPQQQAHFVANLDAGFVHQSLYANGEQHELAPAPLDGVMTIPERPVGVTTTAHSPFPEEGERRGPYASDGESETTGTELESEADGILMEQRHKYDESAVLPQSPLIHRQVDPVYTTSDPLETSLESQSLQSSTPGVDQLQRQVSEEDRHSPLQHIMQQDELETRERFTSASATPDSQQKVLVLDQARKADESDSGEDQQSEKEDEDIFNPEGRS